MSNHYFLGRDSWLSSEQRRERRASIFAAAVCVLAFLVLAGTCALVATGYFTGYGL